MHLRISLFLVIQIAIGPYSWVEVAARDYSGTLCEGNLEGTCQKNNLDCPDGIYIDSLCNVNVTITTTSTSTTPRTGPVNYHSCCSKDCGTRTSGNPIKASGEATVNSWPWQVSLQNKLGNSHFCGAVLVGTSWVATAARCVIGKTSTAIQVVTGEHSLTVNSGTEQTHDVDKIITHGSFQNSGNIPNDIALLKLATPLTFDADRKPSCLADPKEDFTSATCYITGWSITNNTGNDDLLNEVSATVETHADCEAAWNNIDINGGHVCVGTGATGACEGDNGGPLVCEKTRSNGVSRWILAGISSFGSADCKTSGLPNIYSRVSNFRNWLIANMRAN